jgi:tRNA(fMet)-specific endonuclease VapC
MYLLDTNVCIKLLNGDEPRVSKRLAELRPSQVYLCSIVHQELFYGAYRSARMERNLINLAKFIDRFTSLPFDEVTAKQAGEIQASLSRLGTPIGGYDLQIAAIAVVYRLILVTHNTREFSRVQGLMYEDWEENR